MPVFAVAAPLVAIGAAASSVAAVGLTVGSAFAITAAIGATLSAVGYFTKSKELQIAGTVLGAIGTGRRRYPEAGMRELASQKGGRPGSDERQVEGRAPCAVAPNMAAIQQFARLNRAKRLRHLSAICDQNLEPVATVDSSNVAAKLRRGAPTGGRSRPPPRRRTLFCPSSRRTTRPTRWSPKGAPPSLMEVAQQQTGLDGLPAPDGAWAWLQAFDGNWNIMASGV